VEHLSTILGRELELLETLLFRLEEEQLVLAHGRDRWLPRAAHDVERAIEDVRATELLRAGAAAAVGLELGLGAEPALSQLAASASEPWGTILEDLRTGFLAITAEIESLAEANRDLITAGYRSARETLLTVEGGAPSYDADGAAVVSRSSRLDRSL
jgi:hypothetical protein